jgi:hypothetical protein
MAHPNYIHADITLSNGAVATHTRHPDGHQEVHISYGDAMTEEDWQEYCEILKAEKTYRKKILVSRQVS